VSDPSCASSSTPSVGWLHPATSAVPTNVTILVDANPGPSSRSTTITVAGQTITITQNAPLCGYNLGANSSPTIPGTGGSGSVKLTVTLPGCSWSVDVANNASANFPWLHITSAKSASSTGNI